MFATWKKSYDKSIQHIKKHRHHFADKGPFSQNYCFPGTQVWIWQLDHKEGWMSKNWYFQIMVLEKTLESPLVCKEINPVNPNQLILNLHWKDWCWSSNILASWCRLHSLEKILMLRKTESKMKRVWQRMKCFDSIMDSMGMNWANSKRQCRQWSLECYSSWDHKYSDMT